ncbi:hypothetical protein [Natronorubrum sp. FCH18a]|uniref:hypothetical protein n=1 Tax=Natronorubrum sp. FCH18a TaxID=3447018 RepID=UPI003F51A81C
MTAKPDRPSDDAPTPDDARSAVKQKWHKYENPAITTGEVADELGVDLETAFELLEAATDRANVSRNITVQSKPVAGDGPEHHVWW